jgi:copper chaperone CopZ
MQKMVLHIEGMSCGHCLNAVNQVLSAVSGVKVGRVQIGRAEVEVPETLGSDPLVGAVEAAGYNVALVDTQG